MCADQNHHWRHYLHSSARRQARVIWRVWQDEVTRRIIGWSLAATMTAELVISALQKAIRNGLVLAGAIIRVGSWKSVCIK